MKVTAALLAAFVATSLPQAAGAQSAVPPVPLDQASTRGLRVCLLNLSGGLPFAQANLESMVKAGALPLPELSEQELKGMRPGSEGIPQRAAIPSTMGRVFLASYSQKKLCRVVVFDDADGLARKAVIGELSASKVWHGSFDETKEGTHMQGFDWPIKSGVNASINVSGPDTPTDGGKGMQLMVTVAYTTTDKSN